VRVTDGSGELTVRVTSGATGLFGTAAPQFGFDVVGVLGERDGVWQVFPRSTADVVAHPMPEPPDAGIQASHDATAGANPDAAGGRDASVVRRDAGGDPFNPPADDSGCSCTTGAPQETMLGVLVVLGLFLRRRRA